MGLSFGTWFLWNFVISLRNGFVVVNTKIQFLKYTRQDNPVEFWVYMILCSGAGLALYWLGFNLMAQ
jgi:hypothetical protein